MKKLICIIILFSLSCKAQNRSWFDDDKVKHYEAGRIITEVSSVTLFLINPDKPLKAAAIGTGIGIFAGAFKEIVVDNLLKLGHPDKYDFAETAHGSIIDGTITFSFTYHFYKHKRQKIYNALSIYEL